MPLEEREKDVCKNDCKFAVERQMGEVTIYEVDECWRRKRNGEKVRSWVFRYVEFSMPF